MVVIWFAMELVAVDHAKLIVKNHVMVQLTMVPLTVTLVWPAKWIQIALNVVSMLLLMNQHAFVIYNASDLVETVSWFVPMAVLTQPLPQLRPLLLPRQQPRQLRPLRPLRQLLPQPLPRRSVKDVGLVVPSIADHQNDLMIPAGSGKIPMITVVSQNYDAMKIVIRAVSAIIWNYAEPKCAHPKQSVTWEIANVHLDTLHG